MKTTAETVREFELLVRWATGRPVDARSLNAFSHAARRVGADLAGDLAVAVTVRVVEKPYRERTDELVLRSVWSTVKQVVRDAVRLSGHGVAVGADGSQQGAEAVAIRKEESAILAAAMSRVLDEQDQELLLARAEGKTFAEIAASSKRKSSAESLRQRAVRAAAKLREALKAGPNGDGPAG